MKSKILIILPNDTLGGAEQYLKNIAEHFQKNKNLFIYIYILKSKKTGNWEYLKNNNNVSINYIRAKSEKSGFFLLFNNLLKIKRIQFDYIFTSHIYLNAYLGLFKKFGIIMASALISRESTVIFQRFKGFKLKLYKICYYLGYSSIDLLICQTENMKTQLIDNLPWIESKVLIKVIKNPIVIPEDLNINLNDTFIKGNYIVSAGRLIREKGFDILIDAFKLIQKKHPDLKLVILGEGQLRIFLENKIRLLNLQNKVILKGFVDNVYSNRDIRVVGDGPFHVIMKLTKESGYD